MNTFGKLTYLAMGGIPCLWATTLLLKNDIRRPAFQSGVIAYFGCLGLYETAMGSMRFASLIRETHAPRQLVMIGVLGTFAVVAMSGGSIYMLKLARDKFHEK